MRCVQAATVDRQRKTMKVEVVSQAPKDRNRPLAVLSSPIPCRIPLVVVCILKAYLRLTPQPPLLNSPTYNGSDRSSPLRVRNLYLSFLHFSWHSALYKIKPFLNVTHFLRYLRLSLQHLNDSQ